MAKVSHVSNKVMRALTASAQTLLGETRYASIWEESAAQTRKSASF